jgi:hypothetical protein
MKRLTTLAILMLTPRRQPQQAHEPRGIVFADVGSARALDGEG